MHLNGIQGKIVASNINFMVGNLEAYPPLIPGTIWRTAKGPKAKEISGEEFDYYLIVSKSKTKVPQIVQLNHPEGPKIVDKDLRRFYRYAQMVADSFNVDIRDPIL